MKVSILKNIRLRRKFCGRMNKTFGCKDAYRCGISCPLWLAKYSEESMNERNLPLGEAYRLSIREAIDRGEGRKIIQEMIRGEAKYYPDITWETLKQIAMSSLGEELERNKRHILRNRSGL